MNVNDFLNRLEAKRWLTAKQIQKLRQQVARAHGAVQLNQVQNGLVKANLLSQDQVDELSQVEPDLLSDELWLADDDDDEVKDLIAIEEPEARPEEGDEIDAPIEWESPAVEDAPAQVDTPKDLFTPTTDDADAPPDPIWDQLNGDVAVDVPTRPRRSRWDRPLIIYGGGAVVLLVLVGIGLFALLHRGSGDEMLQAADGEYDRALYPSAIEHYDAFLQQFSSHPKVSRARVRRGLATIRHELATGDGLRSAQEILPALLAEEAFPDARSELSGILPELVARLVKEAHDATSLTEKETLLGKGREAMSLVDNSAYLPSSLRRAVDGRVEQLQRDMEEIDYEVNRQQQLAETVVQMRRANEASHAEESYQARSELLRIYPELIDAAGLIEATRETAESERADMVASGGIAPERWPQPVADDVSLGSEWQLALADRRGTAIEALQNQTHLVQFDRAVYAFDLRSGGIRWRRVVGYHAVEPRIIGSIAILWHGPSSSLLGCDAISGDLVWRLPLDTDRPELSPRAHDVIVNIPLRDRNESQLMLIRASDGTVVAGTAIPRATSAHAIAPTRSGPILVAANHSTLYLLDGESLACLANVYLGHAPGALGPINDLDGVVVVPENLPTGDSQLRGFRWQEGGGLVESFEPIPLLGHCIYPGSQLGPRRGMMTTDRGVEMVVSTEVVGSDRGFRKIAATLPLDSRTSDRYHSAFYQGQLWSGSRRLVKYDLLASRGELVRKSVDSSADSVIAPFQIVGDNLLSVQRPAGEGGAVVSAWGEQNGIAQPVWQTRIGVPTAGGPVSWRDELFVVTVNGRVYRIGGDALRRGVVDEPIQTLPRHATVGPWHVTNDQLPRLLGDEDHPLFVSRGDVVRAAVLTESKSDPLAMIDLPPQLGTPTGNPTRFGGGILIPTVRGPIHWLATSTGKPLSEPYFPTVEPGQRFAWIGPAILDESDFLLAQSDGRLTIVGRNNNRLALKDETRIDNVTIRDVLYVPPRVAVVTTADQDDAILLVDRASLSTSAHIPLQGALTWGPFALGSQLIVADKRELLLVANDGTAIWRHRMPDEADFAIGRPLVLDEQIVIAFADGNVVAFAIGTGTPVWTLSVGEPLETGPMPFHGRLLVGGHDGTVHVLPDLRARQGG